MRRPAIGAAVLMLVAGALAVAARQRDGSEGLAGVDLPARTAPEWRRPLGAAVAIEPLREDEAYGRRLVSTFTSVTPENALKWETVQPARGRFAFEQADALVDFARRRGMRVRGHPLVWDQQLPDWLGRGDWSAAEAERLLEDHVRTVVGHFRGRVEAWDVVNEPFEEDGSWSPSLWHAALGERYVEVAFRAARAADPQARLFLNEIAAEHDGPKARALHRLARELVRRGVPVDGVGLQNHTTARGFPDEAALRETMRRFDRDGLLVEITEMDVALRPGEPPGVQAAAYRDAATACAASDNCTGLTVWGVTDRWSWIGAERRPLLFDAAGRPKPALAAVRSALLRGSRTPRRARG